MIAQYAGQYRQTEVITSSRVQIVVLLYDSAIQSIELARRALETNSVVDKGRFLGRAISILGELDCVLDYQQGGEIARSLHRIYDYIMAELVAANTQNKASHLDGPARCLSVLREAWMEITVQEKTLVGAGR